MLDKKCSSYLQLRVVYFTCQRLVLNNKKYKSTLLKTDWTSRPKEGTKSHDPKFWKPCVKTNTALDITSVFDNFRLLDWKVYEQLNIQRTSLECLFFLWIPDAVKLRSCELLKLFSSLLRDSFALFRISLYLEDTFFFSLFSSILWNQ